MLEGDAAATDAVLAGQKGGTAAGDRGPRAGGAAPHREETIPGHSFEQTKPGTPGASGRESRDVTKWQGARVPGPLQVSRTPGSGADNKRFSSLSHRLCGTPSPTTEPKPGAGRKQRSSNQRPPALEGRALSPARAPGPGASEDPTLSGPLCSLLARK